MNRNDYIEKIKFIADRMLQTRPRASIKLRPYIRPAFASRTLRRGIHIDLMQFYGQAEDGDYAYVSVNFKSQAFAEVALTVKGTSSFTVNGNRFAPGVGAAEGHEGETFRVTLNEGDNLAVFQCVCKKDRFALDYTCAHVCWPQYWTCDYLLWVQDRIPMEEYCREQGFCVSELIPAGVRKDWKDCSVLFPEESKPDRVIDFNQLYAEQSGRYGMAYSVARQSGELMLKPYGSCTLWINGRKAEGERINLTGGDEIKVICERTEKGWGFECPSDDILYLPQVSRDRKRGCSWLLLGAFADAACREVQFKEPYENADGGRSFWRFCDQDTYLRPYLDTSFYGQWFYAVMVGEAGLLRCSEYQKEYYDYFYDSMSILYEYYAYMQLDAALFGDPPFLKRSVRKGDLDSIGTIGMNLCELYRREEDAGKQKKIMAVLEELKKSIYRNIHRMEDGCFYRGDTMWADDTFMSCPFLVRMGNLTGDEDCYREVVHQLLLYWEKLYLPKENLFSHIYYPDKKRSNNVPWGRGNGWVYLSFIDVITHLPAHVSGRDKLVELFQNAVSGLVEKQSETGLWHQVLNRPDSYLETSCTAIFAVAMEKGIRGRILEEDVCLPVVKKAVDGLLSHSVDEEGNVTGVCRGSGCKEDASYYAALETIENDDHGTGMVLDALCGLCELME